ncbi:hypothetical protein SAMN02745866_02324 [Alteromonadaceae bacterium Bs31]|nr:hypothetical protein SAMN02745866_02324 [Alteromonadaceae bacterium Bs31]
MKKTLFYFIAGSALVSAVFFTVVSKPQWQLYKDARTPTRTTGKEAIPNSHAHTPGSLHNVDTEKALIELENTIKQAESILADDTDTISSKTPLNEPAKSWKVEKTINEKPSIPLSEQVKSYEVVKLEGVKNLRPAIGDTVKVPLLDGAEVEVVVSHVEINKNGDYIWSGHVKGFGDSYPVTMTIGKHSAFASITTIDGSYSMESVNELGWLYKNPAEAELSTNRGKDYLEIPEHAKH